MPSKKSLGSPEQRRKKPPRPPARTPLTPEELFSDLDAAPPPSLLSDERPTEIYQGLDGATGSLFIEAGRHAGVRVLLGTGSAVIGRSSKCALQLKKSAGVSRRHAKVVFEGGAFYLEDLESRNGTQLNGKHITGRLPLRDGDLITISEERIRYQGPSAPRDDDDDDDAQQDTALFDDARPKPRVPKPVPTPPQVATPPPVPARARPAPVDLSLDIAVDEIVALDRPKERSEPIRPAATPRAAPPPPTPPTSPALSSKAPSPPPARAPARPPTPPPLEPMVFGRDTGSFQLGPLGIPDDSVPPVEPPALPLDSSPYVHQPKPRRSSGLFVVGGFLGVLIALGLVAGWDLSMNEGALVDEALAKAEALLVGAGALQPEAPDEERIEEAKVEEPKVEEPKTEEAKLEEPKTEEARVEEPKTEEPKTEDAKVEDAKVVEEPKTEEPAAEAPRPAFTVRTPAAGVIESVRVKVGDRVAANAVVLTVGGASPTLQRKLKALRREQASFEKFAAQGNERAKRDLEEVRREIRSIEAQARSVPVRTAARGRVTALFVKKGETVKSGVVVAKVTPE